jgi:uncharacterized membrane protein
MMDIIDQPSGSSAEYLPVNEVISRRYRFDFGGYFDQAISILKNNIGSFMLATLVMFAIQLVVSMIPVVGGLGSIFIAPALTGGLLIMARKARAGESPEVGDLFAGFKGEYYGKILGTYLLTILISIPVVLLALGVLLLSGPNFNDLVAIADQSQSGFVDPDDIKGMFSNTNVLWLMLPVLLLLIYISISLSLAMPFVLFHSGGPTEAIRSSFRIVNAHWFMFLVYFLLLGICAMLGILALCVGILVTYPLIAIGTFTAFDRIMRTSSPAESL